MFLRWIIRHRIATASARAANPTATPIPASTPGLKPLDECALPSFWTTAAVEVDVVVLMGELVYSVTVLTILVVAGTAAVVASEVGAETESVGIEIQLDGATAEKVSEVGDPMHPSSPQHCHSCSVSFHSMKAERY